jgi:hypothetical protein
LAGVIQIQDQLAITPLSKFLEASVPEPAAEIQFPPYSPDLYGSPNLFSYLNLLMQWHTPRLSEVDLMKRFALINVGPNLTFDLAAFLPEGQEAIKGGVIKGHQRIEERGNQLGTTIAGWDYTPPMGNYSQ